MLSGYPISTTTATTVAQNATPGFLRSGVMATIYPPNQRWTYTDNRIHHCG
jgi:hypothetical protein